mgnify:CR=1 FL=1
MPDEVWALSETDKEERIQIDSDLCRLDERYFLRGVAYIPVNGTDKSYGWGVWAEVSEEHFFEYVENYEIDNSSTPTFNGKVANQISSYNNTLNLPVEIKLGNETQRPTFIFNDQNHLLTEEQINGICIEKVHSFSE